MRRIDPLTRFHVDEETGCWLWDGPVDKNGYGRHGQALAHRLVFTLLVGPIPDGCELDHVCRVTRCVNPSRAHLEPVPHRVNVAQGLAGTVNGERQRSLTHCKRNHEFTPENTRIDQRGHRACRTCSLLLHRGYYHADIEASRAKQNRRIQARKERTI